MSLSLLIATIGLVPCCFPSSDKQSDLKSRLLEEGPAAWRALDERVKQVEGSYQIHSSFPGMKFQGKNIEDDKEESSFLVNQSKVVWTSKRSRGVRILLMNNDYRARLTTDAKNPSTYSLLGLSEQDPSYRSIFDVDVSEEIGSLGDVIRSPWAILYQTLSKWFDHPGFTIIRVEGIEGPDANELVKVTFKYQPLKKSDEPTISEGEMVLDPSNRWCLKSYRLKIPTSNYILNQEATYEYDGERAGIPFLRMKKEILKTSAGHEVRTVSFTDLKHRVASDDEFTLSAFGLPEPNFQPTAPTPQYLTFLALAAVFLAAFLWMRGRKARRTNLGVAATA